ncbi:MAG: hypothetical protein ACJAWV_002912 [Flammeovirgaceae bacterium]|jgi:hypothetical protein
MKKTVKFSFLIFGIISFNFANCQKTQLIELNSLNKEVANDIAVFGDLEAGDILLVTYQEAGCFHFQNGNYKIYKTDNSTLRLYPFFI